jgi:NAD(P)-dependent dehydrogenase (short-subunit alcohol dehydrogenase family)
MKVLHEHVAVITGASSGIGRAVALHFASRGARVVLAARDETRLGSVAEQANALGGEALAVTTDVTDEAQVQALVDRALSDYKDIHTLVNCAGISGPWVSAERIPTPDWRQVLDVNLTGTYLCCRAVLPTMIAHRRGHIINISSDSGKRGEAGGAAYCASKFGVMGFSQALSADMLPHGVSVHAICPGYVDTPWYDQEPDAPREQMLKPEDIAELAFYLSMLPSRVILEEVVLQPRGMILREG